MVVDDEGHPIPPAQGADIPGLLEKRSLVQFLFPQLHAGHTALQSRFHLLIQRLLPGPSPVSNGVKQHIPLIALHNWLPSPVPPGSGGTWHR